MKKAVIFDVDGTLLDSEKIFIEFVKDVDNFENEKDWETTIKLFCKIEKSFQEE